MRVIESRRELALGVALVVGAILASAWISIQQTRQLHGHGNLVSHTNAVLSLLNDVMGSLVDAESSQRGYIITGDESFLEPFAVARDTALAGVEELTRQTADNSVQQAEIPHLRQALKARLDVLEANHQLRNAEGFDRARDAIATGGGRELTEEIRNIVARMTQHERGLLATRSATNDEAFHSSLLNGLFGALLALIAVAAFLWVLRRYLEIVKKSTATIHEQRELLRGMLLSIGDGVIAADRGARVTLLNGVAETLTGWSEAEALGRPLEEVFKIVNEETRTPVENPARRALRDGRITGLANHTILLSRGGDEFPIDDVAAPVRNQSQEISGVILVFREIRERKRQENELRRHAQALQDADRRKDEFLATLAHELRNPLSPLSNALQLWPRLENDREQMEQLRQLMERQVLQMTRLIDDLLDVSRITRGKIELRTQPIDLQTLVHGAVETVQSMIAASEQRLTIDLPHDPVMVEGDVARLTQVFGNILHNAAKYTGLRGNIHVAIDIHDGHAEVTIGDDGAGIPAEMLTRIFEMFQQVDQTLERSHGGLGIGLTLVKRLVELHQGRVEAFSPGTGMGSRFVVTLPILTSWQFQEDRREPTQPETSSGVPRLRVLVVDDVQASAKTLALMLQSIGQETTMLHDGRAALEWIAVHRPDVIFLDIAMPGMNGYEVARRIRSDADGTSICLVALTGYGQEDDRRRAIEAGFDYHMTKPTSISSLEQLLMTRPQRTAQTAGQTS